MRREKIIPIRVNEKEGKELQKKADELGLSLATFMRMASLNFKSKKGV